MGRCAILAEKLSFAATGMIWWCDSGVQNGDHYKWARPRGDVAYPSMSDNVCPVILESW